MKIPKLYTNLLGTPAAPSTIGIGATTPSALMDADHDGAGLSTLIAGLITVGSTPPDSITIRYYFYMGDTINPIQDGGDQVIASPGAGSVIPIRYPVPFEASAAMVSIEAGDQPITAWIKGGRNEIGA